MKRVRIKDIILSYRRTNSVRKTAQELGIGVMTVSRWVQRGESISQYYVTYTYRDLRRKSTRPRRIQYKLSQGIKEEIVKVRERKHVGAKKLVYTIDTGVSSRTVHRFLKRKGLIPKQKQYRRPLFQNGRAMRPSNTKGLGYIQMDTKHVTPELSGLGYTVYEYAGIDIVSRYKLAVIFPDCSSESASLAMQYFLKWFPFDVKYVQTDNGLEYQYEFEKLCKRRGIEHYYIHKNSPNENAVIERSFRTDQDEFYYWLEKRPHHIGELNEWLQTFIHEYNTWRPHQALEYKTPEQVVNLYHMS